MRRGKYIVIDGLSSRSKSAAIKSVVKELQAQQLTVRLIEGWDSYSDLTVQTLYRISEDSRYPKTSPTTTLLENATFAESLETIRSSLEEGITCVVDRSFLTALVTQYYGQANGIDYGQINELVGFASAATQPDLLVVIDTPVSQQPNEAEVAELERLRAGYLWEAKQRNLPVIYTTEDAEHIFTEVWKYIAPVVAERPHPQTSSAPQSVAELLAGHPAAKFVTTESPTSEQATPDAQAMTGSPEPSSNTAHRVSLLGLLELSQAKVQYRAQEAAYEERNEQGHYQFFVPTTLKGKPRSQYIKGMNQLFDHYTSLLVKLTDHFRSSSDIPKKAQDANWRTTTLDQARQQLQLVLPVAASKQVAMKSSVNLPAFIRQELGELVAPKTPTSRLKKLADELLPPYYTGENQSVSLVSYTPHNELDTLPDLFYTLGDVPLKTLRSTIAQLPYQRKVDVLAAYFADNPQAFIGGPLENVRYSFEVVSSFAGLLRLTAQYGWSTATWQPLSPRLGYDTPEIIEAASLEDTYDQCFDLSLELHSALQAGDSRAEAQYVTLQGHKQRWQVTLSAPKLYGFLHSSDKEGDPEVLQLAQQMYDALADTHPLLVNYAGLMPLL